MPKSRSIFIFLFVLSFADFFSQVSPILFEKITLSLKDSDLVTFNKGKLKFEQESYMEALPFFEKIIPRNAELPELNYIAGICYSYDVNHTEKALEYIYKAKPKANEIDGYFFNLGYALEKNDSISAAMANYQLALSLEEKAGKSVKLINEIKYRLNRCKKLLEYKNKKNFVKISNLGPPINSNSSEYCPLITSNESVMIFTYRGPKSKGGKQILKGKKQDAANNVELFFEDIFMSKKINDSTWSEPVPIESLNTKLHDAAVSLNSDGTQLFIYRNIGVGKGDLYLSELVDTTFGKPVFQSGLSSSEWDGSACFIPNQNKVIFASERKGGFGGKDLYTAERIKANVWGNIKNLGPVINTKYDEDAPFVTADGKILFFSSNNSGSLGGYDIFRSDLKNENWQVPYNLGPPINTKNDDKFFIVRADGKVGYYSSYKQGGKGDQDIYKIEPGIPGVPIELLEVNGYVTVDGKPAAASIEINSVKNTKFSNSISSNVNDGNFLSNLPAGDHYELIVKVDNFPQQVIELNTVGIDSFVVLNVFAEFTSPEFDKKLEVLIKSNTETEAKRESESAKNNGAFDKEAFASKFGNAKKEGLAFKVQIGAYKFLENFNYNNIIGFPKIIRQTDNDFITRFVMGHFETYNEALDLIKKIKKAGVLKDCFIIANYKGEKKQLPQLLSEKIIE